MSDPIPDPPEIKLPDLMPAPVSGPPPDPPPHGKPINEVEMPPLGEIPDPPDPPSQERRQH